ncbi:hypothetical protein LCGC14_1046060 [marine sediment metagenome]|uniref:Uncharacterized protein n=1 Tax=marine sediment metagenome TaxID=412755 RepID=A0A0F9MUP3_9ZZZZ
MFHRHKWETIGLVMDTTLNPETVAPLQWTWTLFQCRRNMKGCWRFKLEAYL